MILVKLFKSFINAFNGLKVLIKEQNFIIHILAIIAVLILGFCLRLSYLEWGLVVLCCSFVMGLEIINTAIEKICNIISTDKNPLIKQIKDISASAVLVQAIASLIIALILLNEILGIF